MTDFKTEKAEMPVDSLSEAASPFLKAWFEIVHLKQTFRKGWLQRDISPLLCESVGDHTFGNAMLCLLMLDDHPELDPAKVLRMALLHDVGEAYVGDITPQDGVPTEKKKAMEKEAAEKILLKLPNGQKLLDEWLEYEKQSTPEARFVKQIDRFELALQAAVYHQQGHVQAAEFIESVGSKVEDPSLQSELESLQVLLESND